MTTRHMAGVAFAFLTRLPVRTRAIDGRDLGQSLACFPLVGFALGGGLVACAWLLDGHVAPQLTAVVLVALLAGTTGGLHLDGLADTFDGFGSGTDRDRALAVMRDSRIGAHGAVAVVLVLMAKMLALAEVIQRRNWWHLALFPAVGRWAVLPAIVFFPYLRPDGLGRPFNQSGRFAYVAIATALLALAISADLTATAPSLAAVGGALTFSWWAHRRLGGLTGDVYGAAIELSEAVFLIAIARPE